MARRWRRWLSRRTHPATGCRDGIARVFNLAATGEGKVASFAHDGEVSDVAFSPDGKLLATASNFDRKARIFRLSEADSSV